MSDLEMALEMTLIILNVYIIGTTNELRKQTQYHDTWDYLKRETFWRDIYGQDGALADSWPPPHQSATTE